MNKEEIEELMEYNLEYIEARNSEDIFGGDYTSSVDLKYANETIDELQQESKQLKDNWNKLKEWLEENWKQSQDIWFVKIISKMQELEKSDSNE